MTQQHLEAYLLRVDMSLLRIPFLFATALAINKTMTAPAPPKTPTPSARAPPSAVASPERMAYSSTAECILFTIDPYINQLPSIVKVRSSFFVLSDYALSWVGLT
jgi:hypothetical protein